jgi:YD repeat-containing protein
MGSNTYDYDCNGNQTQRVIGGVTYTLGYDAENRLVSVTTTNLSATFTYDGDGNRVKTSITIGGTTTRIAYIGGHTESNYDAGVPLTRYYFAGAQRIAVRANQITEGAGKEKNTTQKSDHFRVVLQESLIRWIKSLLCLKKQHLWRASFLF